jgi:hypothetical protein
MGGLEKELEGINPPRRDSEKVIYLPHMIVQIV